MDGYSVVKAMEACGDRSGATAVPVMIADSGVLSGAISGVLSGANSGVLSGAGSRVLAVRCV